jgi:hypothetical protein
VLAALLEIFSRLSPWLLARFEILQPKLTVEILPILDAVERVVAGLIRIYPPILVQNYSGFPKLQPKQDERKMIKNE